MLPPRGTGAVCASAVVLTCAFATPARGEGEPHPEDRAFATALFQDGRKLLEQGHVEEACRKFEESQRLDPGGGTLLNLAECRGREGRTATSWAEFTEALAQARREGRADRVQVASARIAALEPRLSRLSVVVAAASDRDGLDVTVDGTSLGRPAWGMAVPIDPGEHTIEARAPGMRQWSATITIGPEGDARRVEVPPLEPLPPSVDRATGVPAGNRVPLGRDISTLGAAVVGVGGVALGSYFGLHAISLNHEAAQGCPDGRCTNAAAATSGLATSSADASTVSFAVGAAGLVAAAALLFTRHASPSALPITAVAVPGSAWVSWQTRF